MLAGLLAIGYASVTSNSARAQTLSAEQRAELIQKGKKLAQDNCAKCHSIKKTGASPNAEAPPFRTFSQKWPIESLEESLAEGIVTGHAAMPEVVFTPEEIGEFLEFLDSLQSK